MTLQQFRTLSQNQHYRYLLVDGACIGDRMIEDNCILLFQLGSKFMEVFMNTEEEKVLYTRSFEDTEELRPYL